MKRNNPWEHSANETITKTKHLLANLSIKVRTNQFEEFLEKIKPTSKTTALDVGVTSDEVLKDSNLFEKLYPWSEKLTVATIEDPEKLKKLYPRISVKKVYPGKRLPYPDKCFDVSVSWATLEHVGGYKEQEFFLNELLRVGKKVFVTTPYRGAIYEPHTGLFLLHWLPLSIFRKINRVLDKDFWANADNLNPLYVNDIKRFKLRREVDVSIYKTFEIIPTHIIITA